MPDMSEFGKVTHVQYFYIDKKPDVYIKRVISDTSTEYFLKGNNTDGDSKDAVVSALESAFEPAFEPAVNRDAPKQFSSAVPKYVAYVIQAACASPFVGKEDIWFSQDRTRELHRIFRRRSHYHSEDPTILHCHFANEAEAKAFKPTLAMREETNSAEWSMDKFLSYAGTV